MRISDSSAFSCHGRRGGAGRVDPDGDAAIFLFLGEAWVKSGFRDIFAQGKAIKRDNGLNSKHPHFRLEFDFPPSGASLWRLPALCAIFPKPHNHDPRP
jgi:hypothetical protein